METKWTLDEVLKNIIGKSEAEVIGFFMKNGERYRDECFTIFLDGDEVWVSVQLSVFDEDEILSWGVIRR
jgi:hypothetical protein